MQIQDRTFLVTGGGSGLGAATARRLVEAGGLALLADDRNFSHEMSGQNPEYKTVVMYFHIIS